MLSILLMIAILQIVVDLGDLISFQTQCAATQKSPIKHQKILPTKTTKEMILANGVAFTFSCMIVNLTFHEICQVRLQ